jgi:two-component system, NarL family, sensor histidine kinase DegS
VEYNFIMADGTKLMAQLNARALLDASNKPAGYVLTIRDITEQKRLRDEREQFTRKLMEVQEEERKRISRDLHDETAQKIALITLELDSLCQKEKGLPEAITARINKIRETAENTLQEVRRFSHELRPSVLEHFGLSEALELIVDEMNSLGQIVVDIRVTGSERRLSEETEIALFRITQEALSNIRKHSLAQKAKVDLRYTPNKVKLMISDNGKGFNIEQKPENPLKSSLGLIGMRERAQLIGAKLHIKSMLNIGTTISVELDMPV